LKKLIKTLLIVILLFCVRYAMAQQYAVGIKTELKLNDSRFRAGAPINVDVWIENQTERDMELRHFNPFRSDMRLPTFMIVRVPDGEVFSIPPGLYGDEWVQWYQPDSEYELYVFGNFTLPSGKRIRLLHGDMRLMVVRARDYCQGELDKKSLLERRENESTKKHYQEIVRQADDFLSGGTFDISIQAYSKSETIRITVDNEKNNSR
jgi:hypothetical protein